MKELVLKTDPKANPNQVGELLRDMFFAQNRENGSYGCYSCFELRDGVESLPDEPIDDEYIEDGVYTCAKKDNIKMMYYWDGDGTLIFLFEDGSCLYNSDCKKDYEWEYYTEFPPKWDMDLT